MTTVRFALLGVLALPACATAPADAFFAGVAALHGQAFAGEVIESQPPMRPDDPFAGQALVMHVRGRTDDEVRIPFHVGEDHSRTWILTRTPQGLRLKHDHRHADGQPDTVTMYGGDTVGPGTHGRQEFPVDAETRALFERNDLAVALTNVWALELEPGRRFVYELARPDGRRFRVAFDLTSPVPTPPAPWGHE